MCLTFAICSSAPQWLLLFVSCMVLVSHVRLEQLVTAVPQGLEDQGEARPQGEAEPARALLVPAEDRQQDSLQRQAPPLAPHQAELLSCLCLPAAVLLRSGPCLFAAYRWRHERAICGQRRSRCRAVARMVQKCSRARQKESMAAGARAVWMGIVWRGIHCQRKCAGHRHGCPVSFFFFLI